MQYDVKTPSAYMKALDKDWRRNTLQSLRQLIKTKAPNLLEGISYKMLSYSDDDGGVFALNAQKNYVSFYVGNASKIDSDGSLLEGLSRGKGCIRFTKSVVVSETRIDEFIELAIRMHKRGVDIGC